MTAIDLSDRVEEAYARLSGAAASLPAMPLHRADHVHLLSVVAKPKPKPRPVVVTPSATTPPSAPATSTAADQRAVATVITSHWQAINAGDYAQAYSYFSSRLQSEQARSNWINDKLVDRPQSSPISIESISIAGDTAYASVTFRTIGQETSAGNTGCNAWAGSYRLVRVGSGWYLDDSTLQRTSYDLLDLLALDRLGA